MKKEKTVCFTGHRTLPKEEKLEQLKNNIIVEIIRAVDEGYDTFLFGGSFGFDMLCANTVLALYGHSHSIRLIAVIPFEEQANNWSVPNHEVYFELLAKCNEVITLNFKYHRQCYAEQSDYMVSNSTRAICYMNGKSRRCIAQIFKMARDKKLQIINLFT